MRQKASLVLISIGLNLVICSPTFAEKENKTIRYRVEDILTLSEISTYLYGTKNHWPRIAKLNRIRKPYPVWKGRVLKLPFPRTLTHPQGLEEIAQMRARQKRKQLFQSVPSERTALPIPSPEPAPSSIPEVTTQEAIVSQQAVQQAFEEELKKDSDPIILGEEEPSSALILFSQDQKSQEPAQVLSENTPENAPSKTPLKTEEELFREAEAAFLNKDFATASSIFKVIRTARPAAFKSWISEIRCHLTAGDNDQARETARLFVKELPEYEQIPLIQKALAE